MPSSPRRRYQFRLTHMLLMMLLVAVALAAAPRIGYVDTEVEIREYDRAQEHLTYVVPVRGGFAFGGLPVEAGAAGLDLTSLQGRKLPLRYRSRRVLWLPAEHPTVVAHRVVESALRDFVTAQQAGSTNPAASNP